MLAMQDRGFIFIKVESLGMHEAIYVWADIYNIIIIIVEYNVMMIVIQELHHLNVTMQT